MSQKGHIPDIFKIMKKYDLTEHFNNFVKTNTFPSKIRWKHLVKRRVHDRELGSWKLDYLLQSLIDSGCYILSIHPMYFGSHRKKTVVILLLVFHVYI